MKKSDTYEDGGEHILQFLDTYDVVCPKCEGRAHVHVIEKGVMPLFSPRRLSCTACGYANDWRERSLKSGFGEAPVDWYFRATFWYRRRCCGHELWVANKDHLEFLKKYIGAKIRSHVRNELGWSNRSLSSRLPRWITSAANRKTLMKALEEIEEEMDNYERQKTNQCRARTEKERPKNPATAAL